MNTRFWQSTLSASCLLWGATCLATPVEVTIVGEGRVSVKETDNVCEQDCVVNNTLPINTFVPEANTNWKFSHWSGASCDAGNGVLYASDATTLSDGPNGAKTLLSGDFDGDGDIDFISILLWDGTVNQMINEGGEQFASDQLLNGLKYPSALADYDWDADGDVDVLVVEYNRQRIVVLENDGNGQFSEGESIWLEGISPYALTVEDENDDGFPDLLVSSFEADTTGNLGQLVRTIESPAVTWYHNDGAGNFTPAQQLTTTAAITLDSDRDPNTGEIIVVAAEVVSVVSDGAGIVLFQGQQRTAIQYSDSAYGAALADIDGNGTLDVLAAHYVPSRLNVIYQDDEGNFAPGEAIGAPQEGVTATAIADIDGDGMQEIVSAEFNIGLFYFHRAESYSECVVNNDHQLDITANFVLNDSNDGSSGDGNSDGGAITPPPAETSGGGTMGVNILLLTLVCLLRRNLRVNR